MPPAWIFSNSVFCPGSIYEFRACFAYVLYPCRNKYTFSHTHFICFNARWVRSWYRLHFLKLWGKHLNLYIRINFHKTSHLNKLIFVFGNRSFFFECSIFASEVEKFYCNNIKITEKSVHIIVSLLRKAVSVYWQTMYNVLIKCCSKVDYVLMIYDVVCTCRYRYKSFAEICWSLQHWRRTVCFSKTVASICESTQRHNPEKQHGHLHRHENLK